MSHVELSITVTSLSSADLAAVDNHGATAWDYARGRQLHYCTLILASYIRQRGDQNDADMTQFTGMEDSMNGINHLKV